MVGNVCVIFTVTEGILMWERVYKTKSPNNTMKFNFSMGGTLFLPGMLPDGIDIRPDISIFKQNSPIQFLEERINKGILPSGEFYQCQSNFNNNKNEMNIYYSLSDQKYTFNVLDYKNKQQGGKSRTTKCLKCKKNIHGGKCYFCGFIPFLGKTQKKRKGKKTQKKNKRNAKRTRR